MPRPNSTFGFDPWSDMALARRGKAFSIGETVQGQGALYSQALLWNPKDSGVYAYVNYITAGVLSSSTITMYELTADPGLTALAAPANRMLGGATAAIKAEAEAAALASYGNQLGLWPGGNVASVLVEADHQYVLPPGSGILLVVGSTSDTLYYSFFWYELAT